MIRKGVYTMNLLNMLFQSMSTDESVNAISKRSGGNGKQVAGLVAVALPLLLHAMTNNASSSSGASSLLSALGQHTNTAPMASQIQNANLSDGNAILGHIFGNQMGNVVGQLSQQTGMTDQQVSSALGSMAPAILSGLSAATQSAQTQQASQGYNFTNLLQTFGGAAPVQQQQQSGGLLSGLLSAFTGGGQAQQQPASGGLLSSLLGGAAQSNNTSGFDGSNLLAALLSSMK